MSLVGYDADGDKPSAENHLEPKKPGLSNVGPGPVAVPAAPSGAFKRPGPLPGSRPAKKTKVVNLNLLVKSTTALLDKLPPPPQKPQEPPEPAATAPRFSFTEIEKQMAEEFSREDIENCAEGKLSDFLRSRVHY